MNEIQVFLKEINESNSTNYKLDVLKKYKESTLVKRVLKMTHDNVIYNYGIGKTTLLKYKDLEHSGELSLQDGLDFLENKLATRELTGNAAISALIEVLQGLSAENADIIKKIIERDLRINVGRTGINKVHKELIERPAYMRCDVLTKKTAKNITYSAVLEKKSDGTYREFSVDANEVSTRSRSGESYDYPTLNPVLSQLKSNVYTGEMTVRASEETMKVVFEKLEHAKRRGDDTEELEEIIRKYQEHQEKKLEYILPRGIGNGILNSDDIPSKDVIIELWDCVSFQEYNHSKKKDKKNPNKTPYSVRFQNLKDNIAEINDERIRIIEHVEVHNSNDVMLQNKIWMEKGYEGSVLKDWSGVFEDGTSKKQLKIKLKISAEMRIIGFQDGTIGTKREGKVGSIIFGNDEGTIKGRCSGFSDEFLEELTNNKEYYLGKIFEVEFNDLSRATGNQYYALSHPRYMELRDEKDTTDTLEEVFKMREMAMDVSSYFEK